MKLWKYIEQRGSSRAAKNRMFLTVTVLLWALAGGIVWLAVGRLVMPGIDDLLAFLLVPAVLLGFFGGIVYLYNHEFKDGYRKADAAEMEDGAERTGAANTASAAPARKAAAHS